jgi:hypothetical protein
VKLSYPPDTPILINLHIQPGDSYQGHFMYNKVTAEVSLYYQTIQRIIVFVIITHND